MSNDREVIKSKVESLNPRSSRIYVTVKVISKNPVREVASRRDGSQHRVTEALVGDETGAILMTLWDDDIERVNEEDVFEVNNAYITLFRGSMRLNIGRYGSLDPSEAVIETIKADNNLSDKEFEQERSYGGFRRETSGRGRF